MSMVSRIKLNNMWKKISQLPPSPNCGWRKSIAQYGDIAWTLKKDEGKHIQTFESKSFGKLMRIPWTKLMTNEWVYKLDDKLLSHIQSCKLRYFGQVVRQPQNTTECSLMTGLVEGDTRCGRPTICWFENIAAWTGLPGTSLLHTTWDRRRWQLLAHSCSRPLWHYIQCYMSKFHGFDMNLIFDHLETVMFLGSKKEQCKLFWKFSTRKVD